MAEADANQINEGLVPVMAAYQNATIDPKSPYCLSTSDHPGLLFVTNPLEENGENYFMWGRNMLNTLVAKNKAGFVNGRIEKLDVNSRDFEPWVQYNAIVLSWITNALDKELQNGAAHAETANEVWADLQERFTQGLAPRVYELKRAIALLQQEKAPISTYYGRLKAVWNELEALNPVPTCTCGFARKMQSMRAEEKVFDFLMGLDESFGTVRSQVLSIDPLPTLGRAYAIMAQEEKQKSVAKRTRSRTCGEPASGGRGNTSLNSQTSAASSGFAGIIDSSAGTSPIQGLSAKQHQQLLAILSSDTSPFANLVNNMSVQIPNGDLARVHALGTVKLDNKLVLKNVLGVPDFYFNMLSDLPLMMPIGLGKMRDGLYCLETREEGKALMAQWSKKSWLWHQRLGHLSMDRLSFVPVISCTPGNKTPFEMLFGKSPTYAHLRTFGCLCYGHFNNKPLDKFAPHSQPGIFLGYPHGQKGYKVFDLASKNIYVSREVQFFEENFPFSTDMAATPIDPISSFVDNVMPHGTEKTPLSPFGLTSNLNDSNPTRAVQAQLDMAPIPVPGPFEDAHVTPTTDQLKAPTVPSQVDGTHTDILTNLARSNTTESLHLPNDVDSLAESTFDASNAIGPASTRPQRHCNMSQKLRGFDVNLPPSLALPSSLSHPPNSSVNSTALLVKAFSSIPLDLYLCGHTAMPIGLVVPLHADPPSATLYFLGYLLFLGCPRNNLWSLTLLLKLSIALWLQHLVRSSGSLIFYVISKSLSINQFHSFVTIKQLSTLPPILSQHIYNSLGTARKMVALDNTAKA
ncbi:hypothetical protein RJ639_016547 [Escallonia herrerae]|uniref:GAG-pre-integrase domain-containing protein n=1 Tax=Escallonia herrerae TaxID=1293975 RepID=A0AA89AKT7_9ASTE|nr:hypothetical protein RJ639_016547 [Escallonia herrerae]